MSGSILLGENYTLEEDSNGDLVITDADGTAVISQDNDANTLTFADESIFQSLINISDLVDDSSNNTVYDTSAEEIGDGNQSVNVLNVTLQNIVDTSSGNTVYDSSTETIGDGNQDADLDTVDAQTTDVQTTNVDTISLTEEGTIENANRSDQQIVQQFELLSDNEIAEIFPSLSTADTAGWLLITVEEPNDITEQAMFALKGSRNEVSEALDPDDHFTTTSGNDTTINIYWSGSQYEIENKDNDQRGINLTLIS